MKVCLQVFLYSLVLFAFGCNGSLTEEQRKAFQNEMKEREIKKINENEIFRKALEIGQEIVSNIDSTADGNSNTRILKVHLQDSASLNETERKILMAYAFAPDPTAVEDNIQKQGLDSLIYSTYVLSPDSLGEVLFVKMARAKVVLAL